MKKESKKIVGWTIFVLIMVLLFIIIKNWDGFINGFNTV
jgi:hypothetical protein